MSSLALVQVSISFGGHAENYHYTVSIQHMKYKNYILEPKSHGVCIMYIDINITEGESFEKR